MSTTWYISSLRHKILPYNIDKLLIPGPYKQNLVYT